jgi:hypothetical protein
LFHYPVAPAAADFGDCPAAVSRLNFIDNTAGTGKFFMPCADKLQDDRMIGAIRRVKRSQFCFGVLLVPQRTIEGLEEIRIFSDYESALAGFDIA